MFPESNSFHPGNRRCSHWRFDELGHSGESEFIEKRYERFGQRASADDSTTVFTNDNNSWLEKGIKFQLRLGESVQN